MDGLTTVLAWHLWMTAVMATALAALIFGQYLARYVRQLARSRRATRDQATVEDRLQDAA